MDESQLGEREVHARECGEGFWGVPVEFESLQPLGYGRYFGKAGDVYSRRARDLEAFKTREGLEECNELLRVDDHIVSQLE